MTTDGKWTASTREERWDSSEEFDTREEALEYAKHYLANEMDLEDGASFFTGQVHAITPDELAAHGADAWRVVENLSERLYELLGDELCDQIKFTVTPEQETDLDARLAVTIRDWMIAHGLAPKAFTIEHVETHSFEQCEGFQKDETDPADRCVLHTGHDGDHEYP